MMNNSSRLAVAAIALTMAFGLVAAPTTAEVNKPSASPEQVKAIETWTYTLAVQAATFAAPLGTFAARITTALGVPCFEHALKDADAAVAGVQAACTVTDHARTTGATAAVPACDDDPSGTCWRMVADAARCPLAPGNLRIAIERPGAADLTGVTTTASCAIE